MQRNHLATETSPYLLQHANNPVEWYPWGPAALKRAARENRPILLSIGYSACHWCHVMAHESFEDPETAALMNRQFVNIKVDREERPDLDRIYQLAQQLITRSPGGWPLTLFLAPKDQRPFFGGTYFPRERRQGLPAFRDILERVAVYHENHAPEIQQQNAHLMAALMSFEPEAAPPDLDLDTAPLHHARRELEASLDPNFGGFGRAPKFPQAPALERCLQAWHGTSSDTAPDLKALYMATLTLTRMAEGGIYDQLGGGFARYSVDDYWMIPHFEKMLYDNGQLLNIYAQSSLATGEALFARVAAETADWLLRDMRAPEGAFYSSLDADTDGQEGKFYGWHRDEVENLLEPAEYARFSRRFGLDRPPNFESLWHLHAFEPWDALGSATSEAAAVIEAARAKLLAARNSRVSPARDTKILVSWNALVIKGMAAAGRILNRPDLITAASEAVDFLHQRLWRDGRLLATYKDGHTHLAAYLDDYAFLADALLELLQSRWRTRDLRFARDLVEVLLDQFEDRQAGGFYFTASDHEQLIHRSKSFSDDSLPSGNGIAVSVLTRLGHLLGESRYLDAAERTLKVAWPMLLESPMAHMCAINALEGFLTPTEIIIIRGDIDETSFWARKLGVLYAPHRLIFAIEADATDLPPALEEKRPGAVTTAYLCTGTTCSAPLLDLAELSRQLAARLTP